MMVWRLVANFRASAAILMPLARACSTSFLLASLRRAGRPSVLPSDFARARPDCVRSMRRSRSLGDGAVERALHWIIVRRDKQDQSRQEGLGFLVPVGVLDLVRWIGDEGVSQRRGILCHIQ